MPTPGTAPSAHALTIPLATDVHFLPFDGGGVLFRPGQRHLWVLNASAAYVWCALHETGSVDAVAQAYQAHFALQWPVASRDVEASLHYLREQGLLSGRAAHTTKPPPEAPAPTDAAPEAPARWAIQARLTVANRRLEFCSDDQDLGEAFLRPLRHLVDPDPATDPAQGQLALRRADPLHPHGPRDRHKDWAVYLDGELRAMGLNRQTALPHLFTLLFTETCSGLQDHLLFHAAALGDAERVVLFPAESGAGKTTLAALLAARGHRYYTDELAAVDPSTLRLLPVALPMSIKPGSLAALRRAYPGLDGAETHLRADGKTVRYLAPPDAAAPADRVTGVIDALVFPRYVPDAETQLLRLDATAALDRLAHTGSSDRELRVTDIQAMIALATTKRCYELIASDLEVAVAWLERDVLPAVDPGTSAAPQSAGSP